MKLKKVISVLSVAVTVAGMALPTWAQKPDTNKHPNPYVQAELEELAARLDTTVTSVGTVTRYKENTLPKVDAATSVEWGLHSLDIYNSRYMDLDQINTSNVKTMSVTWAAQTFIANPTLRDNNGGGPSTQPIVVDGIMYVTDYPGNVVALNAETGARIWTFLAANNNIVLADVATNWPTRGVTYADGIIYAVAGASIFALDPKTGQPVTSFGNMGRSDAVLDYLKTKFPEITAPTERGFFITMAPQYYVDKSGKGILITTTGIAEARPNPGGGLVIASDAKTGQTLWVWNTIPQGPEDDSWDIAGPTWVGGGPRTGGCIWETPPLDPELGLLYVTAGNPMPFSANSTRGALRHGINLFSNATIALDLETGKPRKGWGFDYNGDGIGDGAFQQSHHEIWDYDSAQQCILYDAQIGGNTVKALAVATKAGLLFMLNRETGKELQGLPIRELAVPTNTRQEGEEVWPTQPFQFSAVSGRIMNNAPLIGTPTNPNQVPVPLYTPPGAIDNQLNPPQGTQVNPASISPRTGLLYFVGRRWVTAWDKNTGELVWQNVLPVNAGATAGTVVTSGDVVFGSDLNGRLYGWDARTGAELWRFDTGGSTKAPPVVYMLNGREYMAIKTGGTVFAFALPAQ